MKFTNTNLAIALTIIMSASSHAWSDTIDAGALDNNKAGEMEAYLTEDSAVASELGSFALMGLGLVGLMFARNKSQS